MNGVEITRDDVERARPVVREELLAAGVATVPADERAVRSALPFYRVAAAAAGEKRKAS